VLIIIKGRAGCSSVTTVSDDSQSSPCLTGLTSTWPSLFGVHTRHSLLAGVLVNCAVGLEWVQANLSCSLSGKDGPNSPERFVTPLLVFASMPSLQRLGLWLEDA